MSDGVITKSREIVDNLKQQEPIQNHLEGLREELSETYKHAIRVAVLATALGIINDLSEDNLRTLAGAGLLHDIGKLDVGGGILRSSGSLTDEQKKEIRKHPRYSFQRLQANFFERIREIVVAHHEHQADPYPRQETRESDQLALEQILAVVDMFDALSHKRSYKEALTITEVEEIMREEFSGNSDYIKQVLKIGAKLQDH